MRIKWVRKSECNCFNLYSNPFPFCKLRIIRSIRYAASFAVCSEYGKSSSSSLDRTKQALSLASYWNLFKWESTAYFLRRVVNVSFKSHNICLCRTPNQFPSMFAFTHTHTHQPLALLRASIIFLGICCCNEKYCFIHTRYFFYYGAVRWHKNCRYSNGLTPMQWHDLALGLDAIERMASFICKFAVMHTIFNWARCTCEWTSSFICRHRIIRSQWTPFAFV